LSSGIFEITTRSTMHSANITAMKMSRSRMISMIVSKSGQRLYDRTLIPLQIVCPAIKENGVIEIGATKPLGD